jgi:TolB protein
MRELGDRRRFAMAIGRWLPALCVVPLAALVLAVSAQATTPVGKPGKITYSRALGSNNDIYTINPDGSGAVDLTNTSNLVYEYDPAYSPTGSQIAFERCEAGGCDLWVMNADGTGPTNLTNTTPAGESAPAFSPDGKTIAFNRSEAGSQSQVWVMNADGSGQVRLTQPLVGTTNFEPDFSPDGQTITFTRCTPTPNHQCDTWVMNADGGNPHALTNTANPISELGGSFSPDGKRIVLQFDDSLDDDLAVINADGSGFGFLTDTPTLSERRPIFSPDGLGLAFAAGSNSQTDIYTSDAAAGGQRNITNTTANGEYESSPSWETIQTCGKSRATIVGDDGPDVLKGTKKRDVIVANGGNDKIKGKGGNDLICGGAGKDQLKGGKGNDKLIGGAGKDTLSGAGGRDSCNGSKGKDTAKACEKPKGIP